MNARSCKFSTDISEIENAMIGRDTARGFCRFCECIVFLCRSDGLECVFWLC